VAPQAPGSEVQSWIVSSCGAHMTVINKKTRTTCAQQHLVHDGCSASTITCVHSARKPVKPLAVPRSDTAVN
jgi:hypothetical protein